MYRGVMEYKRIAHPRRSAVLRTTAFAMAGVVLLLAVAKVADLVNPEPAVGHWRDESARSRYLAAYDEVLVSVPAPDQAKDVFTSFGSAHVLVWKAPGDATPVVLVPGHSSGAPMWTENLPHWIGKRTIYALDPIGDAGLSSNTVPLRLAQDQARWVAEAITGLGLSKVHVVGHSFGGAVAAQLAVDHPGLVASLSLAEPVVVVSSVPASMYLWATILLLPTPQSWRDRAMAEIGGTTIEEVRAKSPMSELVDSASRGYSAALPMPKELSDEQWRALSMPVRLDVGSASEIAGGQGSVDRIRSLLPQATAKTWPTATHSLPMDEHQAWSDEVTAFWLAAD